MHDHALTGDSTSGASHEGWSPIWLAAGVLVSGTLFVLNVHSQRSAFIDDTYIFYRYAANWAAGYGPVFNVGEAVEGYSSLLWTGILALVAWFGGDLEKMAPLLGFACATFTLIIITFLALKCFPESPLYALAVPAAVALSTGLAHYTVAGMDTPLFTLLLTLCIFTLRLAEHGVVWPLGISLPLLVVGRAEGAGYALAMVAVLGVLIALRTVRLSWPAYGAITTALLVMIALQFGWRYWYYGELVPATVLAKGYVQHVLASTNWRDPNSRAALGMALEPGLRYASFLLPAGLFPVTVLTHQLALRKPIPPTILFAFTVVAISVALTVLGSGDWMPFHRHMVVLWPLLVLSTAWAAFRVLSALHLPSSLRSTAQSLGAVVVVGFGLLGVEAPLSAPSALGDWGTSEWGRAPYKRQVGMIIQASGAPVSLVTNIAGRLPYFAGPRAYVWDMYGLTDIHNAKQGTRWNPRFGRIDPAYTFSRPFDLFVVNWPGEVGALAKFWQSNPAQGREYKLCSRADWLENLFYVVVDVRHPVADSLSSKLGCTMEEVTPDLVTRIERTMR